jgi:hypothetical protein
VADLLQELHGRVKALGSEWATYSVVGSAALYLVGYLALRFHLTVFGIGTDLAVLDERYLFTGARFLVYLVSSIPSALLLATPVAAVLWLLGRIMPGAARAKMVAWAASPRRLALIGIVFAVVSIQFVMRQCFLLSNLLLREALPPDPAWLVSLLLNDHLLPLYFSGLVAACGVSLAILAMLRRSSPPGDHVVAKNLLAFLAGVQILLLPINYGVLIVDKTLPRVASAGQVPLSEGEEAWLVWEGKDGLTYLTRNRERTRRALVTLDRADVKRTEIVGFDPILPTLFKGGSQPR